MKMKRIAYAFPPSPMAITLGFERQGCYYIESDDLPQVEGFLNYDDPDLIATFNECDGVVDEYSLRHHPEYYYFLNNKTGLILVV